MKPVIFSTKMVQAILEGRKTQTRRVAKNLIESLFVDYFEPVENWGFKAYMAGGRASETPVIYPRYKPGDTLYVRETWQNLSDDKGEYVYLADGDKGLFDKDWGVITTKDIKWRSPYHMPRAAARIFLEVKSARLERLQEITIEGCMAEGVGNIEFNESETIYQNIKRAFIELWQSIYGKKYPWENNPWVWVIEFERMVDNHDRT